MAVLLLVLLLVLGGLLTWLLTTEKGGRWVLEQVPGLEVQGFEGRLSGEWYAEALSYQDGELSLRIEAPHFVWRPGCLWRMGVCIDRLHSGDITLQLPGDDEELLDDGEPIQLPEINLPVRILIADLDIGAFHLNGEKMINGANLSARIGARDMEIYHLEVLRDDATAQLEGTLGMQGDWPLALQLAATDSLPDEMEPLRLSLRLDGTVAQLQARAEIASPWVAVIEAQVAPLDPDLPATVTLTADEFQPDPSLPAELTLKDLRLVVDGNLSAGWDITGDSQLATEPALALRLRGQADLQGARLETLGLFASEQQYVALADSQVSWHEGLSATGSLAWRHFPWQRLMPEMEVPPVTLETLDMDFQLQDEDYSGNLIAHATTPEGPVSLNSPFAGDFSRINMPALSMVAEQGSLRGNVAVGFADGVSWDVDLALAGLNPAMYVPELPGSLDGHIRSQGQLVDAVPDLTATVALNGRLRQQPLSLDLDAEMVGESWTLSSLQGHWGDNRVQGSASQSAAGELAASLELALEQLDQFWPGLQGSLNGMFAGQDLLQKPSGEVTLRGRSLGYRPMELTLASLDVQGELDTSQRGSLGLDWSQLTLDEQEVEGGDLHLSGTEEDHQLSFSVVHEMISLTLGLQGGHSNGAWRGSLEKGEIQTLDQDWQMDQPAALVIDPQQQITLGEHCWRWQEASLCMEDQLLFPQQRLRITLSDLPTAAFAQFLPEEVRWQETLNGRVVLDMDEDGPRGEVVVDAGEGRLELRQLLDPDDEETQHLIDAGDGEHWIELSYQELRLSADLKEEDVRLRFDLFGHELGRVALDAHIDTRDDSYPLEGEFSLDNLNLALARSFIDLQVIEGLIDGQASLRGTLAEPELAGQLSLSDGRLRDPTIPMVIDYLALQLDFTGTEAELAGELHSGEEGRAQITGTASWLEGLRVLVNIDGDQLPVMVEPFATLTIVPRLEIRFDQEQGLFVGGRLGVPRGTVVIRELPDSAIQVSDDEEIAGEEENGDPMDLRMDLLVVVGEDRVSFDGFGVTGNLEGRLRLVDDMQARGELALVGGRYQIYGQRLNIRRALVTFSGPLDQPFLDIEAVRETRNVVAGIRLTGRADDPQAEIFSEPSMSEQQALSYILLGRPLSSEGDGNVVGEVALSLGLAQTAPMTRGIGERFGIQDLQLETEGAGDDAAVVASGYITERLSIRYGVGLFQPVNRVALRYDLTQRTFLEAASGLANSLDIFYQRDY
ncbi:MAG: translocation/assembly module TamB [Halomonadaceae bacterium]|nr:MAG: translocation/assembly module TamB [Halomonadaceae bacterium]